MVRIASGVYQEIREENYKNNGVYRIDSGITDTMKESLMYKLSYYRFDEVETMKKKPLGYDVQRNSEIGYKGFKLKYFEEAFTSERWWVRIYRVKEDLNREDIIIRFPRDQLENNN